MSELFRIAYLGELFLWAPLLVLWVAAPSTRRWLVAPLVASALAAAYEAYMTFVWAPKVVNPIRLDIFLVMAVTGIADALSGIGLATGMRNAPRRTLHALAAAACLAVPALGLAGFAAIAAESRATGIRLDQGRRLRFEAAFRDDAAQARAFGNLAPGTSPWAGYYRGDGGDDRFAHLVVNDAGRFWLYHSQFHAYPGAGAQTSPGTFEGKGDGGVHANMRLVLKRRDEQTHALRVDFGSGTGSPKEVLVRRAAPPRFPVHPAPTDEVRFAGVFATTYGEDGKGFWAVQAWLWESRGQWWGRYLRDYYVKGQERPFVWAEAIEAACESDCSVLAFRSGRGPVRLTRLSDDAWRAKLDGVPEEVTLRRGEVVPGFLLDLAPTATRKQNREWLEAVTAGHMLTWASPSPPPAGAAEGRLKSSVLPLIPVL